MNRSTNQADVVRLGEFELNVRTGELFSIGRGAGEAGPPKVLLREQPFQILRTLVERQGQIVTRQEIRQILWPDNTIVEFDRSINVAMVTLRKALADNADHPTYIETLARRGYRLIAPVEWQRSATITSDSPELRADARPTIEDQTHEQEPDAPRYPRNAAIVGVSAVVIALVGYMAYRSVQAVAPPQSTKIMLAVLPFENLTGDPGKEYYADGLTEETISRLGRLDPSQLGVIGRTSVMGYKHTTKRLDQIGRDLSVQYVLENSLRQNGNHLRITVQLLQAKDQSHLWSHEYEYQAQDVLAVQENVAASVAREIQLRLTARQQAALTRSQAVNPEAFDAYLQGHYFFQRNTDQDTYVAGQYYERATKLDSSFALAWVGLSRVRKWQAMWGLTPAAQGYQVARKAVERALALDPSMAAAHVQLGRMKAQVDLDWTGADTSFQHAVELEPGNPEVVSTAASSAATLGRFDEALQMARRAVELDPLNAGSLDFLAEAEFDIGQLDQAAADGKKALKLSSDVWPGRILQSKIYLMQGHWQDALSEIVLVRDDPLRAYLFAMAYHGLGRKQESDSALNYLIKNFPSNSYTIAEVYAFRNQLNEAFEWLDRAHAQRNSGMVQTKSDPFLKNLHHDPRYAALLKRLNFPS